MARERGSSTLVAIIVLLFATTTTLLQFEMADSIATSFMDPVGGDAGTKSTFNVAGRPDEEKRFKAGDDISAVADNSDAVFKNMFVLGDSYVDTGNLGPLSEPYGLTFPGKPFGRWSDGRILTDFIALYLDMESPIPYNILNQTSRPYSQGVNFAFSGSGVFNTDVLKNLSFQLDLLQETITNSNFSLYDLENSIVLICTGLNDYRYYLKNNNTSSIDLQDLSKQMLNQFTSNLEAIHHLGLKKIAITTLAPMGCIAQYASRFQYLKCDEDMNQNMVSYNTLLKEAVEKLNMDWGNQNVLVILDLYWAFNYAMDQMRRNLTNLIPLKPCCPGLTCKVDDVCKNPELSFYFDSAHPSQNGWNAVYLALKDSLDKELRV